MPFRKKRQNATDSAKESQLPRKRNEPVLGREEVIEEAQEHRIFEEKEDTEEHLREEEVRHGHAHTPYFEYDNPSYVEKGSFSFKSYNDKKKQEQKK